MRHAAGNRWRKRRDYLVKRSLVDSFESALGIDLKALPLFLVADKRGNSSRAFLRNATVIFSNDDVATLFELTLDDVAEAGRGLLLHRHPAAGFHTMRALEAVALGYYQLIFSANPVNRTTDCRRD
jgi:hypothetical protein